MKVLHLELLYKIYRVYDEIRADRSVFSVLVSGAHCLWIIPVMTSALSEYVVMYNILKS